MVTKSPSATSVPPTVNLLGLAVDPDLASAPHTAGMPSPRATTAAWLLVPPAEVRMPSDRIMPW